MSVAILCEPSRHHVLCLLQVHVTGMALRLALKSQNSYIKLTKISKLRGQESESTLNVINEILQTDMQETYLVNISKTLVSAANSAWRPCLVTIHALIL